jgi:hypothetical protein
MQQASANGDAPENWEGWGEVGSASMQRLLARRHGSPSAEKRANHGLAYEMHGTLQLHGSTKMRRPTVRQAAARRGAPSPRQFGRDGEAIELQSPGQQPHSAALRVRTCLGANVIRRRRARSIASFDEASKHAKRGSCNTLAANHNTTRPLPDSSLDAPAMPCLHRSQTASQQSSR